MLITFILGLVLFCQHLSAFAQSADGSISGAITDIHGAVIADATVVLVAADRGNSIITKTRSNSDGRFTFAKLNAGRYLLKINHTILNVETDKLVRVVKAKNTDLRIELGRACSDSSRRTSVIDETDRAKVVKLTLEKAIDRLLTAEEKRKGFILSTRNIKPEWIKNEPNLQIRIMSQESIQQKADHDGDFLYMSFSEVEVRGSCIAVSVDYSWAVGKDSKFGYVSGGGLSIEYRKKAGKWTGKYISGWVS